MPRKQSWLMKTEPEAFSIEDLRKRGVERWDGVRNYQARNALRDQMNTAFRATSVNGTFRGGG